MDSTGEDDAQTHPDDGLPIRLVTVNDVVSMNLAHFRKASGLSQQELADKIGWLKSVVSTAERSWEARRKRNFTVSDLIDIASGLDMPVAALLLPPEDDGTAITYMVDGLHGDGPRPLRDLVPLAMADSYAYAGQSPAAREFRRRLLAIGWRRWESGTREELKEQNDKLWASLEALRSVAEHAIAAADGDRASALQVEAEMARRLVESARLAEPDLRAFQAEANAIEARVNDLRAFEREYRNRLGQFIENQYRAFWAGTEGADPDQLLSAMRDQALGRPHVITVPAAGTRDDQAPEDALLVMLPEAARRLGIAGARDLRSRGIPGPYVIDAAADGSVTVSSAAAHEAVRVEESVRVEKESAGEGERLPAVLLPRPGDEEAARPELP